MILFIFDYFLPVLNNVIFSQSKSLEYLFDVRQYSILLHIHHYKIISVQ